MLTDKQVKNLIETKLTSITNALEYDIQFEGDTDYYNHDWIKRHVGTLITPFSLRETDAEISSDGLRIKTARYILILLGFSKDRNELDDIINVFINDLSSGENELIVEGEKSYNVAYSFLGKDIGVDFAEGSGSAQKRFEIGIEFEVSSSSAMLNTNDVKLEIENERIPFRSLRIDHGKENLIARETEYSSPDNKYTNNNTLVVEVYVTDSLNLLNSQNINMHKDIKLTIGEQVIYDNDKFLYLGYQFSTEQTGILTAYLYFEMVKENIRFKVNDKFVNVLSYSIGGEVINKPIVRGNDAKFRAIGKAKSFSLEISDNDSLSRIILYEYFDTSLYYVYYDFELHFFEEPPILMRAMLSNVEKKSGSNSTIFTFIEGVLDG